MLKIIFFSLHLVLLWFLLKAELESLLFKSLKVDLCILMGIEKKRTMFWKTVERVFVLVEKLQHHCHYDPEVKSYKTFSSKRWHMDLIIFMWIIIFQTNCRHELIPPRKTGVYLQTNCLSCLFTVCFLIQQDGLWGVTTRAVTALAKSHLAFNPFLL